MCPFVELLNGGDVENNNGHLNIYMMVIIRLTGNKNTHRQLQNSL